MPSSVVTLDSQARRDERRRLWRAYVHSDAPQGSIEGSAARVVRAPVRVRPPAPVLLRRPTPPQRPPRAGNPLPWLVVSMLALEVLGLLVLFA
jgi:hypothetical protein